MIEYEHDGVICTSNREPGAPPIIIDMKEFDHRTPDEFRRDVQNTLDHIMQPCHAGNPFIRYEELKP
jgi:hypothetical protein